MDKKMLLIGGASLVGVAVLYMVIQEKNASIPSGLSPAAPAPTPAYPVASGIQPAPITINEAPLQLTYNQPNSRIPPSSPKKDKDGCKCKGDCNGGITDQPPEISPQLADAMTENLKRFVFRG